jgi:hypothetical protein
MLQLYFTPPINVLASGILPFIYAPEKSKPGFYFWNLSSNRFLFIY